MIFNITFEYKKKSIVETIMNIYPTSVSSKSNINDYKPILLEGEEYNRVMEKIEENSISVSIT